MRQRGLDKRYAPKAREIYEFLKNYKGNPCIPYRIDGKSYVKIYSSKQLGKKEAKISSRRKQNDGKSDGLTLTK